MESSNTEDAPDELSPRIYDESKSMKYVWKNIYRSCLEHLECYTGRLGEELRKEEHIRIPRIKAIS